MLVLPLTAFCIKLTTNVDDFRLSPCGATV